MLAGTAAGGLGVASLGLVGCGGDDDSNGDSPTTAPGATTGTGTTAPGGNGGNGDIPTDIDELRNLSLEEMRTIFSGSRFKNLPGWSDGPKYGGTLRFGFRAPVTWDPTSPAGGSLASYMHAHSQLIGIRVNDMVENPNFMEYESQLAETMPEQPDELSFVLKLKPGIKFHNVPPVNGRELTAEDVLYATEVYRSSPVQGPTYDEVAKVEAVDSQTIKFTMERPTAYFVTSLASPFHWIFSKEQHTSPEGLARTPIGTGPFLFEKAEDLGAYSFVKNPDYFRDDPKSGMRLPYLDRIQTTYYANPAQQVAAFRAGEFDHLYPQTFETWTQVMESNPDSVTQVLTPAPSAQPYVAMRLDQPPFNDKRFRQALSLLVDRQALVDNLAQGMGGRGYGQDWTYFGREWPWEESELGQWNKYDPDEAKKLLDAAGIDEVNLDFLLTSFAGINFEAYQAAAGMWDAAGIRTTIDAPQDPAKWQSQFYSGTFGGMVATGQIGPGMDPDTFTYHAMHSQSPKNYIRLNDPKVDELALKQRSIMDREERTEVVKELMDYDLDYCSRVWLMTAYKLNLRKPNFYSLIDVEAAWGPVGWGSVGLEYAWRT